MYNTIYMRSSIALFIHSQIGAEETDDQEIPTVQYFYTLCNKGSGGPMLCHAIRKRHILYDNPSQATMRRTKEPTGICFPIRILADIRFC